MAIRTTAATCVSLALLSLAGAATAQSRQTSPKQGPLRTTHVGNADTFVASARAQVKAGNCAAALDLFDLAIEAIQDPLLYRDRGLCHEKLGHLYPALDDFRMYLTMKPEANDAEDIRARLATLESAEASERKSEGGSGNKEKKEDLRAEVAPQPGEKMDTARSEELRARNVDVESAETSSLRLGKGLSLGPYLNLRGIFGGGSSAFSAGFGGQLRISVGPSVAFLGEVGFANVGGTYPINGLQTMLGIEGRVRFDKLSMNQLLLVGGIGLEHLSSATLGSSTTYLLPPRVRLGYRHVFGGSLAWDISAEASPFLSTSGGSAAFAVGGQTGLQIGF